jgi:hypothetical protein
MNDPAVDVGRRLARRCCVCRASAAAIAMDETPLVAGAWRCRDQVACRRRVRGHIESAKLASTLDEQG